MIKEFFESKRDIGLLVLRIGIGISFIFIHGWGKMFGGAEHWTKIGGTMTEFGINFAPVFWGFMAALTEFGGGILLVMGLFTRSASAFMAFTMIVAMTKHLSNLDPWSKVFYPAEMFSVFIALLFLGAGKYSLDALLFKRKSI